jgi:3-oxoadipate CoA-transferase beta subunit
MDLAAGAAEVRVLMEHTTKDGKPKIVDICTYPLTAPRVVKRIYTNFAVVDVTPAGLVVRELAEGVAFDALQAATGAKLALANDWTKLTVN